MTSELLSSYPFLNRACDEHRRLHSRCPVECPGRMQIINLFQQWQKSGATGEPPISMRRRGRKRKNPEPASESEKSYQSSSTKIKRRKRKDLPESSDDDENEAKREGVEDQEEPEKEEVKKRKEDAPSQVSATSFRSPAIRVPAGFNHAVCKNQAASALTIPLAQSSLVPIRVEYINNEEDILNELSNSDEEEQLSLSKSDKLIEIGLQTDISYFFADEYHSPLVESPLSSPPFKVYHTSSTFNTISQTGPQGNEGEDATDK
jgi:hypothetical protein